MLNPSFTINNKGEKISVKAKKGKFMCAPRKLEAGAMEMPKRNGRKRGA